MVLGLSVLLICSKDAQNAPKYARCDVFSLSMVVSTTLQILSQYSANLEILKKEATHHEPLP